MGTFCALIFTQSGIFLQAYLQKSIRIEKNIIEGVALEIKTTPDKEQQYLLDLLGVKSLL